MGLSIQLADPFGLYAAGGEITQYTIVSLFWVDQMVFLYRSQMQFKFTEIGKCGRNGKLWESVPKMERFVETDIVI